MAVVVWILGRNGSGRLVEPWVLVVMGDGGGLYVGVKSPSTQHRVALVARPLNSATHW